MSWRKFLHRLEPPADVQRKMREALKPSEEKLLVEVVKVATPVLLAIVIHALAELATRADVPPEFHQDTPGVDPA